MSRTGYDGRNPAVRLIDPAGIEDSEARLSWPDQAQNGWEHAVDRDLVDVWIPALDGVVDKLARAAGSPICAAGTAGRPSTWPTGFG